MAGKSVPERRPRRDPGTGRRKWDTDIDELVDRIEGWWEALGKHPDLRAELLAARRWFARQDAPDAAIERVRAWLQERYPNIWFHSPVGRDWMVYDMLSMAIVEDWEKIGREYANTTRQVRGNFPRPISALGRLVQFGIEQDARVETVVGTWHQEAIPDGNTLPAIVLLPWPNASRSEMIAALDRALESWPAWFGDVPKKNPGGRHSDPGRYQTLIDLYKAWRQWPVTSTDRPDLWGDQQTMTWPEFTLLLLQSALCPPHWEDCGQLAVDERLVIHDLKEAIDWLAPAKGSRSSPER